MTPSELSAYFRARGKLTSSLTIPVDENFKRIERAAREQGFNFAAWARDVLYSRLSEVASACEIKTEDSA